MLSKHLRYMHNLCHGHHRTAVSKQMIEYDLELCYFCCFSSSSSDFVDRFRRVIYSLRHVHKHSIFYLRCYVKYIRAAWLGLVTAINMYRIINTQRNEPSKWWVGVFLICIYYKERDGNRAKWIGLMDFMFGRQLLLLFFSFPKHVKLSRPHPACFVFGRPATLYITISIWLPALRKRNPPIAASRFVCHAPKRWCRETISDYSKCCDAIHANRIERRQRAIKCVCLPACLPGLPIRLNLCACIFLFWATKTWQWQYEQSRADQSSYPKWFRIFVFVPVPECCQPLPKYYNNTMQMCARILVSIYRKHSNADDYA